MNAFLNAVNAAMAVKNAKTVGSAAKKIIQPKMRGSADYTSSGFEEDEEDEDLMLASQSQMSDPTQTDAEKADLDEIMFRSTGGGEILDREPVDPNDNPDRITSGEEKVNELDMEDLIGNDVPMFGGKEAEIETGSSAPIGNSSTQTDTPTQDPEARRQAVRDSLQDIRPNDIPQETLDALFRKTHGGSFDPNSKVDRQKMMVMRDMITEDKSLLGLSPNKFALKVYARK